MIRRMTPPDVLRAVTEKEIGREIVRLVPHWYEAECGPEQYSFSVGEHTSSFCNHCKLTPSLNAFLTRICTRTRELPLEYFIQFPSLIDVFLESMAIDWLQTHSAATDWARLIKYLETVARRTYENRPVSLNLIIRAGAGVGDITGPHFQKFFDQLASSPFSYLAVDSDLRLMHYGEIEWSQVETCNSGKFHPEFLHPIHSIMDATDLSAHLTAQGDLIIMSKAGLLATRRKRKWKIYDVRTFKNSLSYCLGNCYVGANLFEVVFDLSFRRQGALLIYDPEHQIQNHLLNPESLLFPDGMGDEVDRVSGQTLIGRSIEDIAIGKKAGSLKRKRRLIEMACVDGAVVFDDTRLLAVGALIRSHPGVGNQLGARTTAARSAYLWGARPIKVSSDGDVTIYFQSRKGEQSCDAVMNFL
jgi:hypothetical protein